MKFRMVHENYNVADLDKSIAFYETGWKLSLKKDNKNKFLQGVL